jgi:hypothetical protein
VMERTWLRQVLRRDPELAHHYHELVAPSVMSPGAVPFQRKAPPSDQATPVFVEQLSERERAVLTQASRMLLLVNLDLTLPTRGPETGDETPRMMPLAIDRGMSMRYSGLRLRGVTHSSRMMGAEGPSGVDRRAR